MLKWLKESNRLKHLLCGAIIAVVGISIAIILDFASVKPLFIYSILVLYAVAVAMCSVEYIQAHSGIGRWDWLDILAGVIPPFILIFIIFIIELV